MLVHFRVLTDGMRDFARVSPLRLFFLVYLNELTGGNDSDTTRGLALAPLRGLYPAFALLSPSGRTTHHPSINPSSLRVRGNDDAASLDTLLGILHFFDNSFIKYSPILFKSSTTL